jgi:hypothetical protein
MPLDEFPVATSPALGFMRVDTEKRVASNGLREYQVAQVREEVVCTSQRPPIICPLPCEDVMVAHAN